MSRANAIDWKFWLSWTAANAIAFPIGWVISLNLLNPLGIMVIFAIYGAILGLAQWLILRQRVSGLIGWILATEVGMAVGGQMIYQLGLFIFGGSFILGVVFGFTTGAAQAVVLLMKGIPTVRYWLAVNTFCTGVSYTAVLLLFGASITHGHGDVEFNLPWFCGIFVAGGISGAISGRVLLHLLGRVNLTR
jgi:hypothetical protein